MARKFITTAEAASRIGLAARELKKLCSEGRIPGAKRYRGVWLIPTGFRSEPERCVPKPSTRDAVEKQIARTGLIRAMRVAERLDTTGNVSELAQQIVTLRHTVNFVLADAKLPSGRGGVWSDEDLCTLATELDGKLRALEERLIAVF